MPHVMICEETVMAVGRDKDSLWQQAYLSTAQGWNEQPDGFECSNTFYDYFVEHCHEPIWAKGSTPLWNFDGDLVVLKPHISREGLCSSPEIVVRNPNLKWRTPIFFHTPQEIVKHYGLPLWILEIPNLSLEYSPEGYALQILIQEPDWANYPKFFEDPAPYQHNLPEIIEIEEPDFHLN